MRYPRPPRPVALMVVGWALLSLAWVGSNPTGASPDETAHLVKALGVVNGDLTGTEARYPAGPEFGAEKLEWINSVTRAFAVPEAKTFGTIATCNAFQPELSAECIPVALESRNSPGETVGLTHVGPYQPLPYFVLGLPAQLAPGGAAAAVAAGRIAVAGIAVALLAMAAASLWSAASGTWSLLGLGVAVSPMVLFLGSSFSPSGLEVAAGVCAAAGVVGVARSHRPPRAAWVAFGAGSTVMALSRTTGPYWVVALLLLLAVMTSPRNLKRRVQQSGALAAVAVATPLVGAAATVGWDISVMPAPSGGVDLADGIPRAFAALPELMRQAIGVFGWLDTSMPALAYASWRMALLGLVLLALMVGQRRERITLLLAIAGVIAATVLLALVAVYPTNFDTQARYTLPLAMVVPLVAGEIVAKGRHRLSGLIPRSTPWGIGGLVALVHLVGIWSNGRRNAVGTAGPVWFLGSSEWAPPGGWGPWLLLAIAGSLLLALSLRPPTRELRDWSSAESSVGQPGG